MCVCACVCNFDAFSLQIFRETGSERQCYNELICVREIEYDAIFVCVEKDHWKSVGLEGGTAVIYIIIAAVLLMENPLKGQC